MKELDRGPGEVLYLTIIHPIIIRNYGLIFQLQWDQCILEWVGLTMIAHSEETPPTSLLMGGIQWHYM